MNILLSCVGKRGYIARYFREKLAAESRITGTSNSRWTAGFADCDAGVLLPGIDEADYVEALLRCCEEHRIALLLSLFDPDVFRLSVHRKKFEAIGVLPLIPEADAARIAFDKLETYRFLSSQGVATPATWSDLSAVLTALESGALTFPVYLKPRFGFGSAANHVARTVEQLKAFWSLDEAMLAQEVVQGRWINADVLLSLEGQPLSIVPWERHLSVNGETERAETIDAPDVLALLTEVMPRLAATGPADVDMYLTPEGELGILEFNLRFGGGYPVSHLAGADFPAKILRMARGESLQPSIGDYRRNVVMMKQLTVLGGPAPTFFSGMLNLGPDPLDGV